MNEASFVFDATIESFQARVLEVSQSTPVVVDFWADWCEPCKQLMPVLESLAAEYKGGFLLARVNCDEQQELAAQLGIRSLPTVKIIFQGKIANEFSGVIPESQIRAMIDPLVPKSPVEQKCEQARLLAAADDYAGAISLLGQAVEAEPERADLHAEIAGLMALNGEPDAAGSYLDKLAPDLGRDPAIRQVRAKIKFQAGAGDLPPRDQLQSRVEKDANDATARFELATCQIIDGDYEQAMTGLLHIMTIDPGFRDQVARKTLVELFDLLGAGEPLVKQYRRRLYALMH